MHRVLRCIAQLHSCIQYLRFVLLSLHVRRHGWRSRLGHHLGGRDGKRYVAAGLTVARTLFDEPYLSTNARHQGLLLHAIYHRPNGWDHVPKGRRIPCGESCMWGDYHLRELALHIGRMGRQAPYYKFFLD